MTCPPVGFWENSMFRNLWQQLLPKLRCSTYVLLLGRRSWLVGARPDQP
jgi:hypothetical protein